MEKGRYRRTLTQAQLLALGVEVIDGFLDGFAAGAHGDDDAVRIRRADVVEQLDTCGR